METDLELSAVIGFKGSVVDGLILHPDNEHLLFPLGTTIVVRRIVDRTQQFLRGHDNNISVLTVSESGKYIASGQQTHMGFQADVIIWDFETMSICHRLKLLHKVLIQGLTFSFNECYLASVGGQDDNNLVIWDVESGNALCGSLTGTNAVNRIKFYNNSDDRLVSIHDYQVMIWTADYSNKKISTDHVNLGQVKRKFTCVVIDHSDSFAYMGTKTGDIIEISLDKAMYKRIGPVKRLFSMGINCITQLPNGDIMVGSGDGTIAKVDFRSMKVKAEAQVLGSVTSFSLTADGTHFFAGTDKATIYWSDADTITPELRNTCHYSQINDLAFPYGFSKLFATCSINDIRVWRADTRQEMLRIEVPGLECNTIAFLNNGKNIISGWNDGKIRAFLPESGKLFYVINDAHNHGVTAISCTNDCTRIISGGEQGEVRVWSIGTQTQVMETSMKEHRARVSDIKVTEKDDQAVSSSHDGSCIVWDLENFTRLICLFESTMFKQVVYHPDESQLLTAGSDRKITYWDCYDGQAIRMLDGSDSGEINALDITREGEHCVSGGEDKLVKIWNYDEGICYHQGTGHSGAITKVKFSPNQEYIVSVGAEGAIFIWTNPEEVRNAKSDNDMPERGDDGDM
jgi:WD40 repeat protein